MRRRMVCLVLLSLVVLGGCFARQPLTGQELQGPDRKLSTFAYIEQGDLVTMIVGTRAARYRESSAYIPVEIAVVNHGVRSLSLSRESFELRDAQGNRYPMASARELMQQHDELDYDRAYAELAQITTTRFAANARYPSNFSPTRAAGNTPALVRDRIGLPRHGYLIDYVYFPRPSTGILNESFELFLVAPELDDPIFVKFEVR